MTDPSSELPAEAVEEAERLTRLARRVGDPAEAERYEAERDSLLASHGFVARVREQDDTLVCHPAEWLDDGAVRTDRIEDTDRATEVSLSGPGSESWETVEAHNAALVEAVRTNAADREGVAATDVDAHAATARALADFAGNHYLKRIERLTPGELAEFRTEYLPRNGWPSERQRLLLEASLEIVADVADVRWSD